jgi:hypothetical protein
MVSNEAGSRYLKEISKESAGLETALLFIFQPSPS